MVGCVLFTLLCKYDGDDAMVKSVLEKIKDNTKIVDRRLLRSTGDLISCQCLQCCQRLGEKTRKPLSLYVNCGEYQLYFYFYVGW